MSKRTSIPALTMLATLTAAPAVQAQDQWQHTFAFYVWGAGLDGRTQIGAISGEIDASFSDILESLEVGAFAAWRAQKGAIAITVDANYVGLGGHDDGPLGTTFDVDVDQIIVSAEVSFQANKPFEFLVGARYMSMDMNLETRTPGGATTSRGQKEDWIDPYVGASTTVPMTETWSFTLRGDIGGFGVGSELAWNAVARFNWKFSENAAAVFGYRILDVDYETGSGSDRFVYDMSESGPVAGFIWTF